MSLGRVLLAVLLLAATACAAPANPVTARVTPSTPPPASAAGVVDGPGVAAPIVAIAPVRVLDTRIGVAGGPGRRIAPFEPVSVPVAGAGGVPQDAGGVVVNVVATEPEGPGYVTVWPCGEPQPLASNLNYVAGQTIANQSFVKLGGGAVCVTASQPTHLVVDLDGYTPGSGPIAASTPRRVLDTRAGVGVPAGKIGAGQEVRLPANPTASAGPSEATSLVLNVTVTEPDAAGYLTVWPCGSSPPTASNLNFTAGETIANLVVSGTSSTGEVCLAPSQPAHIVVDVDGRITMRATGPPDEPDAAYHAIVPTRVLDTRVPLGVPAAGPLAAGQVLELPVAGTGGVAQTAAAVLLNLTVTEPEAPGWIRAWACSSPMPTTSNVNFGAGQTIAGAALVALGADGKVCLQASVGTHVVVDVQGDVPGALAPGAWERITGPGPRPRWGQVMVLDARRERILVYGGVDQNVGWFDDLWSFSLTTESWQKLTTANNPLARWGAVGVVDEARDRLIVVGGYTTAASDEVWALDLTSLTWSPLPRGPSPRVDHVVATDATSAWYAGGDPLDPVIDVLDDLWRFDFPTNTWTQLPDGTTHPAPRGNSGMAELGGELIYMGGHDQSQVFGDGWVYNQAVQAWRPASLAGSLPAKAHFSYAKDDQCNTMWLFGGDNDDAHDLAAMLAVTAAGDTLSIAEMNTTNTPPGRRHGKIVLDRARSRAYLFGGMAGSTVLDDTWVVGLPTCGG